MPPLRSRKYKERVDLALVIESRGITMPSCSTCERAQRKCVVSDADSTRCSECVRQGRRCDVAGPSSSDMRSVVEELRRLNQEEKETTSKLLRLQKQREFFQDRASEMIRRGLKTMDELDAAEEEERAAAASSLPTSRPGPGAPNLEPAMLDWPDSESFWAALGADDDIPQATQGS